MCSPYFANWYNYYYRARYYDSDTGLFISTDPIGFDAGDSNLYRYVGNSPLIYTDPYGEDLYSVLNTVDKFAAGFGDNVTFGATTKFREWRYGELATRNHKGGVFKAGQITGALTTTAVGFKTPANFAPGLSWAQKAAIGYEVAATGYGAYDATTKLLQGCATPLDALNFLPLAGYGAGRAWDGFTHPSQLGAIDDWLAAGSKNGVRRNLGAIRANHFKNNSTVFYHGTSPDIADSIRNNGIDLSYGRYDTDFGAGFYTSTQRDTALWSPASRLYNDVDVVTFRVSSEWSDFVDFQKTFKPETLMHGGERYDLVTGPLFKRKRSNGDILHWEGKVQTSIHTQEAVDLFNQGIR